MKLIQTIFQEGEHSWAVTARDPDKPGHLIDTNEYLIQSGSDLLLMDPGGLEIFPAVFSAIARQFAPERINTIFASHQDPDIISSLSLWLNINPELKCYVSRLWTGFVPHFGGEREIFVGIPDEGMQIQSGQLVLEAIPAHHLHSAGNFHLYDPRAQILFTGDVGAALLPPEKNSLFVEDFADHIQYMEGFHRRWMGSNQAKARWCARVRELSIDMLCPQHGAIFQGEDVARFIDWFDALEVGWIG